VRRVATWAMALGLLAGAPATAAAVTVGEGSLHALAGRDGDAYAVVDVTSRRHAFALVSTSGRSWSREALFGAPGDVFPDVAAGGDEPVVSWLAPISGGSWMQAAPLSGLAAPLQLGVATGPGRLMAPGGEPVIAAPDRIGDAVLFSAGATTPLTDDAPRVRNVPLGAVEDGTRTLVLDLTQAAEQSYLPKEGYDAARPGRSTLRVLGDDAPRALVTSVRRVAHIFAAIAAADGRIAVTYVDPRGRIMLATADWEPGARWSRRSLGRPERVVDAPAVAIDGARTYVVTARSGRGGSDAFVTIRSPAGTRTRRLGRTAVSEREPQAAATSGRVYAGWSAQHATGERRAVVRRVR
jgi:hypothetical protein